MPKWVLTTLLTAFCAIVIGVGTWIVSSLTTNSAITMAHDVRIQNVEKRTEDLQASVENNHRTLVTYMHQFAEKLSDKMDETDRTSRAEISAMRSEILQEIRLLRQNPMPCADADKLLHTEPVRYPPWPVPQHLYHH